MANPSTQHIPDAQKYLAFLQKTTKVYYTNNVPWIRYQNCLQPAVPLPFAIPKTPDDLLKKVRRQTKVPLIRWYSHFTNMPQPWWWVIADQARPLALFGKRTRKNIRQSLRHCQVMQVSAEWIANNAYDCYLGAYERYRHTKPLSRKKFANNISSKSTCDLFAYWQVTVNHDLAGYAECLIIDKKVFFNDLKFSPKYLKSNSAYALIYTLLDYYLNQHGFKMITNGTRAIYHKTLIQTFLEKFGFHKQYCRLNIIYAPFLGLIIKLIYPLRFATKIAYGCLPIKLFHIINVLIKQETIRRGCLKNHNISDKNCRPVQFKNDKGIIKIRLANFNDVPMIAQMHKSEISQGFLSKLGINVLTILYHSLIVSRLSFVLIAETNNQIIGFTSGSQNVKKLFRDFYLKKFFIVTWTLNKEIFKLSNIKKFLEIYKIPKSPMLKLDAELLAIAVDKKYYGSGVAQALLTAFVKEMQKRQVTQFKVIVGANLPRAINFYKKMGFLYRAKLYTHSQKPSLVYYYKISKHA